MSTVLFRTNYFPNSESEFEEVENAWWDHEEEFWFNKNRKRLFESVEIDALLWREVPAPGFEAILYHKNVPGFENEILEESVDVILVTSKKTHEGIWLFQGWMRNYLGKIGKISLGLLLPSLNQGVIVYMSDKDMEDEKEYRDNANLGEIPQNLIFMQWPNAAKTPFLFKEALSYTLPNEDYYLEDEK